MGNPVVHFEVSGNDGPALQKFYADLFGWKIDASNPMGYGLVDTDSDGQGIGGGITAVENGPSVSIYVEAPDLDVALAKAASLGGKTVVEPTEIPNMVTFAMFSDPECSMIGMVKSAWPVLPHRGGGVTPVHALSRPHRTEPSSRQGKLTRPLPPDEAPRTLV